MTRYEVLVSEEAMSFLDALPARQRRRYVTHLSRLAEDPFRKRPGADIQRLRGGDDPPLYRLRIGDHRVLYFVVRKQVKVTEIHHRSSAHRGIG